MAKILEPADLQGLCGRIAVDVETFGGHAPHLGQLTGLGVWAEDRAVMGFVPGDRTKELREVIMDTWEPGSWLIAHNLKYEARWLRLTAADLTRFRLFDCAVAEHLLDENVAKDLGSVETRRLNTKTKKAILKMAAEAGCNIKKTHEWPVPLLAEYCVNDCRITYQIARAQTPLLRKQGVDRLFSELMDYLRVIHGAEVRGMLIDEEAYTRTKARLEKAIAKMDDVWKSTLKEYGIGRYVNPRSAQQLSKLLYEDLAIPKPTVPEELKFSPKAAKYTDTATSKELLSSLNHPVADTILQIKKLNTANGYMKSYLELSVPTAGGRVLHPDFNITGTVTGRLSCSNPNMQQVSAEPIGAAVTEDGQGIDLRAVFRARPGYVIAAIDYQQMEAVVFGFLAQDPKMLELIQKGGDIHALTAELLFGKYDKQKRKVTKTLNFGLLYGLGRAGLAEMLRVPLEESDRLMEEYLALFKRARPWMAEVAAELGREGYVRYWSGRKRRIRDKRLHYKGVNSVVQGGCADVVARATVRVGEYLDRNGGYLNAIIHDEMVLELPEDTVEEHVEAVEGLMAVPDAFGIPLNTDANVGVFWGCK